MSLTRNGTKLHVGMNKLFFFTPQCSHSPSSLSKLSFHSLLSIMEALVTEPYSVTSHFLHKLSSRQPEMLPENRLQLVCNIHEENQHGCQCAPEFNYSAKPVLWGEEPSFVHTRCLHFPSPPVMASLYKDLVFILHTHSHRQCFYFFYAS